MGKLEATIQNFRDGKISIKKDGNIKSLSKLLRLSFNTSLKPQVWDGDWDYSDNVFYISAVNNSGQDWYISYQSKTDWYTATEFLKLIGDWDDGEGFVPTVYTRKELDDKIYENGAKLFDDNKDDINETIKNRSEEYWRELCSNMYDSEIKEGNILIVID